MNPASHLRIPSKSSASSDDTASFLNTPAKSDPGSSTSFVITPSSPPLLSKESNSTKNHTCSHSSYPDHPSTAPSSASTPRPHYVVPSGALSTTSILPTSLPPSESAYHCSGRVDPTPSSASKVKAQQLETALQSSGPSQQGPHFPPVSSETAIASQSTPASVETTVTTRTTEVNPIICDPEKAYYFNRFLQRRRHRPNPANISLTEVRPLVDFDSQKNEQQQPDQGGKCLVPPEFQDQFPSSLGYLEHLETSLVSNQQAEAQKKSKRPQSWIALKSFVTHQILGRPSESDDQRFETNYYSYSEDPDRPRPRRLSPLL
ncbi:hypothetical protein BGZ54_006183 [Gamsiella multidivaricata]|nr:hypothetical protein BGZ54_006183 [Gamsiella multidivaricata]